jgi:hypothetical protein
MPLPPLYYRRVLRHEHSMPGFANSGLIDRKGVEPKQSSSGIPHLTFLP